MKVFRPVRGWEVVDLVSPEDEDEEGGVIKY